MKKEVGERRCREVVGGSSLAEALAAKPANHRVTRSSVKIMQSGSSKIPVQHTHHNKRSIAARRVPLGTADASICEAFPENELPNPPMSSRTCSGPHQIQKLSVAPNAVVEGEFERKKSIHSSVHFSMTEIAHMCNDNSQDEEVESQHGLVAVERYRVKAEVAPLLRRIFARYGDIAKDSDLHSPDSCSVLLEVLCSVFEKLQSSTFKKLSSDEAHSMLEKIQDLEKLKFHVGWLCKKLSDIVEMKELVKDYPALKEGKTNIEKKEKELESYKTELANLQLKVILLEQNLTAMKYKYEEDNQKLENKKWQIKAASQKDLVDGLL